MDTNEEDTDIKQAVEELQITTGKIQSLPSTFYFYQESLLPENSKEGYLEKEGLVKMAERSAFTTLNQDTATVSSKEKSYSSSRHWGYRREWYFWFRQTCRDWAI